MEHYAAMNKEKVQDLKYSQKGSHDILLSEKKQVAEQYTDHDLICIKQ